YLLSSFVGYEGDYVEFEHDNNTIFYASSESSTRSKKTTWLEFFGLVKSNNSNQSLRYSYTVKCEERDGDCSYELGAIEEKVKDIMKSIEFRDVELEGENHYKERLLAFFPDQA